VTGGGSGIGRAIAVRFADEQARVVVADLDRAATESVVGEITARGGKAIAAGMDVVDVARVDALFARVMAEWGTVDVLVNNAGIGELSLPLRQYVEQIVAAIVAGGPRRSLGVTSRMTDAEWQRLDVHLFGTSARAQRSASWKRRVTAPS